MKHMTISQLQEKLEELKNLTGDVEVVSYDVDGDIDYLRTDMMSATVEIIQLTGRNVVLVAA